MDVNLYKNNVTELLEETLEERKRESLNGVDRKESKVKRMFGSARRERFDSKAS